MEPAPVLGPRAKVQLYRDQSQALHCGMGRYYNRSAFSDLTIVAPDGRKLLCHQVVLSACSRRFAHTLEQGALQGDELPVWGVNSDALDGVLRFFYTGECQMSFTNVVCLWDCAQRLEVPGLVASCKAFTAEAMHPSTCCTILNQALDCKVEDLAAQTLTYIRNNLEAVAREEDFLTLSYPTLLTIVNHCKGAFSDLQLFKVAWAWVVADVKHVQLLEALLKVLHVPDITVQDLVQLTAGGGQPQAVALAAAGSGVLQALQHQPLPLGAPLASTSSAAALAAGAAAMPSGQQQPAGTSASLSPAAQASDSAAFHQSGVQQPGAATAGAASALNASASNSQQLLHMQTNGGGGGGGGMEQQVLRMMVPGGAHNQNDLAAQLRLPIVQFSTAAAAAMSGATTLMVNGQGMVVNHPGRLQTVMQQAQQQQQPGIYSFSALPQSLPVPGAPAGSSPTDAAGPIVSRTSLRRQQQAGAGASPGMPAVYPAGRNGAFQDRLTAPHSAGSLAGAGINGASASAAHPPPAPGSLIMDDANGRVFANGAVIVPPQLKGVCQVDGCYADLGGLRDYHLRYKICEYHLKASSIMKDGRPQRFCQQCGRFHETSEFDGNKRSCKARLQRHNMRRRKRLEEELAASAAAEQERLKAASRGKRARAALAAGPAQHQAYSPQAAGPPQWQRMASLGSIGMHGSALMADDHDGSGAGSGITGLDMLAEAANANADQDELPVPVATGNGGGHGCPTPLGAGGGPRMPAGVRKVISVSLLAAGASSSVAAAAAMSALASAGGGVHEEQDDDDDATEDDEPGLQPHHGAEAVPRADAGGAAGQRAIALPVPTAVKTAPELERPVKTEAQPATDTGPSSAAVPAISAPLPQHDGQG